MTSVVDAHRGYDPRTKLDVQDNSVFLSGTQALVRSVFDQMRRDALASLNTAAFISGYPGSPLGNFDLELARHEHLMESLRVKHLPGHNEEIAATSVYGSQMAQTFPDPVYEGVLGVWYGKGPGLDRAADAIRHAQYVGTSRKGGVLAFVGDDPACKSSSIPSTSEHTLCDLGLPFLAPSSVGDVLDVVPHGVALSRFSGLWTGVRVVTDVADGTSAVPGPLAMPTIVVPEVHWKGRPFEPSLRGIPGPPWSIEVEAEIRGPRLDIAREYGYLNGLNRVVVAPQRPRIAIVAVGHLLHETLSALNELGLDQAALAREGVRLCHVRMPHPLDVRTLREFAADVERVIVVEEKRALVEPAIRDALYGHPAPPRVVGKRDSEGADLIPSHGAIHADDLIGPLWPELVRSLAADRLRQPPPRRIDLPVVGAARAPYFCSGCPHNTSTKVPGGAVVGGGIGCHGITQLMPEDVVGHIATTTQMGGEGAQWLGIAPHVAATHTFQNLGDGTYFHSGQLAIQAAVAAGATITYKLLYNGAIAMTGGQSPAESNALTVPDLAEVLLRQGVHRIIVTTEDRRRYRRVRLPRGVEVWDRSRVVEAQEALRDAGGVTVLIHDQRCAAENRRDRRRGRIPVPEQRVFINERICEGCGDCGAKSNCLSVEPVNTEYGRKTRINQTSCNSDFSCLSGDCPSFVTVLPPRRRPERQVRDKNAGAVAALLSVDPPAPHLAPANGNVIRMPGIGGTGVVTASQIIGTAAMLAGLEVSGMDQTGLSQKAGPVVSDLRIGTSDGGALRPSSKAFTGSVDLLLAFDVLVAADSATQQSLIPGRTIAVISTTRVPTGAMVSDANTDYPDIQEFQDRLDALLGSAHVHWVDSGDLAQQLLGDRSAANILLLGVAAQLGALPVPVEALQQAIELNGVSVEANIAAFRAGRWWVADRGRLARATRKRDSPAAVPMTTLVPEEWISAAPGSLKELVRQRTADLIGYQNRAYARRYAGVVSKIAAAEARTAGQSTALTEAVARNLHKLMAYKDEYEVARLSLAPEADDKIREAFGPGARVYWNLHPPVFRALGLKRKLKLGAWFTPAYKVLYAMRGLRGTPFDPFGHTEVRRLERRLIDEYTNALDALEPAVSAGNIPEAVAMAQLPDLVRGYEHLKLDSGQRFLKSLSAQRTGLGI